MTPCRPRPAAFARLIALVLAVAVLAPPGPARAVPGGPEGLIMMKSRHSVQETLDRLAAAVKAKGLRVFARVDHAANAAGAGLDLRPTQVLIFGNPKLGTPLMQGNPTVAIDLPQRVLAYRDGKDAVWLVYTDPAHLADRHDITNQDAVLDRIGQALHCLARQATQ